MRLLYSLIVACFGMFYISLGLWIYEAHKAAACSMKVYQLQADFKKQFNWPF